MLSFLLSILALVLGYIFYGALVDRIFGPDPSRKTPAITKADGVDYIALPTWKVYMIQFLNIAGTGPIFGAIMGAKFGPASYLWIVAPFMTTCAECSPSATAAPVSRNLLEITLGSAPRPLCWYSV